MDPYLGRPEHGLPWNSRRSNSLYNDLNRQEGSSAVFRTELNNVNSSKRFFKSPTSQDDTVLQEKHHRDVHQKPRDNSWPPTSPRIDPGGGHILPRPNISEPKPRETTPWTSFRAMSPGSASRLQYSEEYPCTWPSCSSLFPRLAERDRHYQTVHANQGLRPHTCVVEGCQARVKSWTRADKLREHNKRWHGPYQCSVLGCPRGVYNGFRSQDELAVHVRQDHRGKKVSFVSTSKSSPSVVQDFKGSASQHTAPYKPSSGSKPQANIQDTITDRITNISISKGPRASKNQDSHFTTKSSRFWVPGRLFKVLWSEPTGLGGKSVSNAESGRPTYSKPRSSIHTKVRRFIVLSAFRGHSICVAVHTYGGRGLGKGGTSPEDHTAIYAAGSEPLSATEGSRITNLPIAIRLDNPKDSIDPMSLVNLTKVYTVEHTVRVIGIGKVLDKDLPILRSLAKIQLPDSTATTERDRPVPEIHSMPFVSLPQAPQTSSAFGNDSAGQVLYPAPGFGYNPQFGTTGHKASSNSGYGSYHHRSKYLVENHFDVL